MKLHKYNRAIVSECQMSYKDMIFLEVHTGMKNLNGI